MNKNYYCCCSKERSKITVVCSLYLWKLLVLHSVSPNDVFGALFSTMQWYSMQYAKLPQTEAGNYSDFSSFSATVTITFFVQAIKLKFSPTNKIHTSTIAHYENHVHCIWFISLIYLAPFISLLFFKHYPLVHPILFSF